MPIEVRSCRKCKQLFKTDNNSRICPECSKKADEQFVLVREFIYDNPNSSMERICEATGVEKSDVINWLRQGRLVLQDDSASLITCETCGKPILTGRYCDKCTQKIQRTLQDTARSIQGSVSPKAADVKPKRGTHLDIDS